MIIDGEAPSGRPRTEYHRLHTIPPELVREEVARNGFAFKESRPGFYDAEYGKTMYFLVFEKPELNRVHSVKVECLLAAWKIGAREPTRVQSGRFFPS